MNQRKIAIVFVFALFQFYAKAQILGCTDKLATNYNASAQKNNGSCIYNDTSITPQYIANLPAALFETSGLVFWRNSLFTHNDDIDNNLYEIDTLNGTIKSTNPLNGTYNKDWEEISQDDIYLYVGDFGNNVNGNRTDLKILRIEKNTFLLGIPVIDTIQFSYSNQTDFAATGSNNTDFDCEAFVVGSDSIYLFTKQWVSAKTSVYSLPKIPGNYQAKLKATLSVDGLITGATSIDSNKLTVLCGYNAFLQPFVYLLYDYTNYNFFEGNKRKINLNLGFHQVEGIATQNGLKYFISNEYFTKRPIVTTPHKLHSLNLEGFLQHYLKKNVSTGQNKVTSTQKVNIFPNPANNLLTVVGLEPNSAINYCIFNALGQKQLCQPFNNQTQQINIEALKPGVYFIGFEPNMQATYKFVKQ